MATLGWEAWVTLAVIACTFVLLYMEKGAPDQLMLGAVVAVWAFGIITAKEAIAGFSNAGLVTVGALFIVVQAVDRSRLLERVAKKLVGRKSGEYMARARLCLTGFAASGFLNNTPLVALLLPIIRDWARSRGFAASKFLIPLSYSTIMGGLMTIIGTSTNLLVTGLMAARGLEPFGFFAPAAVALPVGVVGLLYLLCVAPMLLPGDKGGLFRLLRERGEDLITQVVLTSEFPHLGRSFKDVLGLLSIPEDCLLEVLRPRSEGAMGAVVDSDAEELRLPNTASSASILEELEEEVPLCGGPHDCHIGKHHVFWGFVKGNGSWKSAPSSEDSDEDDKLQVDQLWGFTAEGDAQRKPSVELGSRNGVDQICRGLAQELNTRHARTGDILVLLMSREDLVSLVAKQKGLHVQTLLPSHLTGDGAEFVEVVLSQSSPLLGLDLASAPQHVQNVYGIPLVAVRPRGGRDEDTQAVPMSARSGKSAKQIWERGTSPVSERSIQLDLEEGNEKEQQAITTAGYSATRTFAAGDTLLVLAPQGTQLPHSDFFVISKVGDLPSPTSWYDYLPLVLFAIGLALAAFGIVPMVQVAVTLAAIFTLGRWVPARELRQIVDWNLLILIGAALGFSAAVSASGLSQAIASLVKGAGLGPRGSICLLFLVTMLTTEVITNNAAAALGLPLAIDIAEALRLTSPRPLIMTVMLAASTSYAIPIGYATNLMVMGPGGYTFIDFLKVGIPMDLIYWAGCSLLIPVVFPATVLPDGMNVTAAAAGAAMSNETLLSASNVTLAHNI
mmetsp:Transcript_35363/g.82670  ORF Transcript_35363/g.82670 Transcript_35363/m.82670 type:complete len:786 (+) Transcript_35363:136-2493(+)|eukprot:CAMPEP_0178381880 /NCGR_PEP_ID=MMETSP0689_2-20121128/6212_1 /TAXON_ID=160604 /ORGANISM="Amphidinium massartii, Strain CS-259" /LENGTH=785 /DNA_ID=CAMNT_0020002079 /DNA_START=57 /DNA_END=2414 /DNA_ORIENTATION=-